jgi:hypothetical protein
VSERISVRHTESGYWKVMRGGYVLDVKPPHLWREAYIEARKEAIYQNLDVISIEVCS